MFRASSKFFNADTLVKIGRSKKSSEHFEAHKPELLTGL